MLRGRRRGDRDRKKGKNGIEKAREEKDKGKMPIIRYSTTPECVNNLFVFVYEWFCVLTDASAASFFLPILQMELLPNSPKDHVTAMSAAAADGVSGGGSTSSNQLMMSHASCAI